MLRSRLDGGEHSASGRRKWHHRRVSFGIFAIQRCGHFLPALRASITIRHSDHNGQSIHKHLLIVILVNIFRRKSSPLKVHKTCKVSKSREVLFLEIILHNWCIAARWTTPTRVEHAFHSFYFHQLCWRNKYLLRRISFSSSVSSKILTFFLLLAAWVTP